MSCYFLLSTLFLSFFGLLLFHCLQYNNRRGWAGRNGTGAGGNKNAGRDGGGGSTGARHVTFCSLLCLFLLLDHLLFHCLQYNNMQCWTEQRGAGQGGRRAVRGGRRAGGEGENRRLRRAGGRRSGEGDLDERAVAADGGQGGQASGSGRRLDNVAVILPPPWLRDMLCKFDQRIVIK